MSALDIPLSGVRVVDTATGLAGSYATYLLRQMGAQVTRVITPAAAELSPAPVYQVLSAGKAVVSVDPDGEASHLELERMLAGAQFLFTDEASPFLATARDRWQEWSSANPGLSLIHSRGTPPEWGQAAGAETSLHASALSGVSAIIGEPDRAPLGLPYDMVFFLAGAHLAGAAIFSLMHCEAGGRGQLVDVDASEVAAQGVMVPRINDLISRSSTYGRTGRRSPGAMVGIYPWGIYPCADGYVVLVCHKHRWATLLEMLDRPAWGNDERFDDYFSIGLKYADEVDKLLCASLSKLTRAELFERARRVGFTLGPLLSVDEALANPHITERQSRETITVGGCTADIVAHPYHVRSAPSDGQVAPRSRSETSHRPVEASGGGVLSGVRVVDFAWNWAGPMVGAGLADLGAEVIRVEHRGRLDNTRTRRRPSVNGREVEGALEEVSYYFHQNNRGKLGVTLNMGDPRGSELIRDLIKSSDMILENYTPGTFERRGISYDDLARENPRLIWLSMTSFGRTGPYSGIRTYAPIMSALAGLEALIGYEGEPPVGALGYSFGDICGGSHGLVVALGAIRHARLTGQGQFVDFSLVESQMSLLIEPMLEWQLDGRVPGTQGFRHPRVAPHGNFRCSGRDEWVAISVETTDQWVALADLVAPALAADPQLADVRGRQERRGEIEAAVSAWVGQRSREEVIDTLSRRSITVTPVRDANDLARDWPPDAYAELEHPVTGLDRVMPLPWQFNGARPTPRRAAPLVGEHTREVLEGILGLAAGDVEALLKSPATH